MTYLDSLSRALLTVAHNKGARPDGSVVEEALLATRVVVDIEGNQRQVIDALGRIVMTYDYDMLGNPIHSSSMEAGRRWTLNDAGEQALYGWDSRDHRIRTSYDALRRPTEVHLRTGDAAEILVGLTVYGEDAPEPASANLLGRPYQVFDGAGVVTVAEYDATGNAVSSTRRLAVDYKTVPDWSAAVPLEDETVTTRTRVDALNRPVTQTTPDGSIVRRTYHQTGALGTVEANLRGDSVDGDPVWTPFVTDLDYDAKGQRQRLVYGNGVVTTYDYDPLTFRLTHLRTTRDFDALQELSYVYDPTGNITHIQDDAQQTVFFRNRRVEPSADYLYDATYQLIEASGREHLGQAGGPTHPDPFNTFHTGLDHPGDGDAMGLYTERYVYDAVGNFREMQHAGTDPSHRGWTRTYAYDELSQIEEDMARGRVSNRLTSTQVGDGPIERYTYDAHGNMISMPHLPVMQWNHLDQLAASSRQVVNGGIPETTYYVYGGAGQRVRKVTENGGDPTGSPRRTKERRYLGEFETYRTYGVGGDVTLERETLHLRDGEQRLALVETRTLGTDDGLPQLTRYQLSNHLGSATLELDALGQILSYEEYFPYGSSSYQAVRSRTEAPKRYRYTGKERDEESGLEYHGARYYAPWLGRWSCTDPARIDPVHLYRALGGNPVNIVDPNGTEDVSWQRLAANSVTLGLLPALGVEYAFTRHEEIARTADSAGKVISQAWEGVKRYQESRPNPSPADFVNGMLSSPMPSLLIHRASDDQLRHAMPILQALEDAERFDRAMELGDYAGATESLLSMRSATNQQMDQLAELATIMTPERSATDVLEIRPRLTTGDAERQVSWMFNRRHPTELLDAQTISRLGFEFSELGGDPSILRFNVGRGTAYLERSDIINVRGDVLPVEGAMMPRASMSSRATLAHELGHRAHRGTVIPSGRWFDEWRASSWASKNVPGLTDLERQDLSLDAQSRISEAGVRINFRKGTGSGVR